MSWTKMRATQATQAVFQYAQTHGVLVADLVLDAIRWVYGCLPRQAHFLLLTHPQN